MAVASAVSAETVRASAAQTPGVWHKRLYNNSCFPGFLIRSFVGGVFYFSLEMPNAIPILAGRISTQELNSLKENTGRTVVRPNLQTFVESRLSRIPVLSEVPPPSFDRSVRASVPILQIIAPLQTSIQRPAWFLSCL